MIGNYGVILIFIALCLVGGVTIMTLAYWLGKQPGNAAKVAPYECGIATLNHENAPFRVSYYFTAILFIIFDVEMIFLLPWAVTVKTIGLPGMLAMGIFLSLAVIGFIYEWGKGALAWD